MTTPSDEARVFIRASRWAPWTMFWGPVLIGAALFFSIFWMPAALAVLWGLAMVVRHFVVAGVALDGDGLTIRGSLHRHRIEWAQLASIQTTYHASRFGIGDHVSYLDRRDRQLAPTWVHSVYLVDDSAWRFRNFVEQHGIPVAINPPRYPMPGKDTWRPTPFDHDPFESIRTVRRAVVGPYVVIVRPRGDRFVALTIDERTDEQVVVSDDRADMASAIEAAIDQIHDARRRHAVEE
jgi:hypothetical protein